VDLGRLSTSLVASLPEPLIFTLIFYGLWLLYALGTLRGFTAISLAAKYGQEVVGLIPEE
jgi:hypothetical protein